MPTFQSKAFNASQKGFSSTINVSYRRVLNSHPFWTFGLPFIGFMVAGSFFLTPATAVRYEKHDRRVHSLDRSEALSLAKVKASAKDRGSISRRDLREEYYRLGVQDKAEMDWEPSRVKRLPGEPDGTFD